ncbi:small acid-soluble spore protein O [Siminovitchia fortis]|uniref:small acid-soluble spore protein O n=1 Tax=Siminovitchia fortis TaxID=254758 RepID=UPI0016431459|nr:small acid-soluble spore protein O [Siminovitchia fortis]WHY81892.1 small acid-soluble spore protein O [Siminovitchia fortis]
MAKRTQSNIEGMNPEKKQDYGAKIDPTEPLSAAQRLNNKKRKRISKKLGSGPFFASKFFIFLKAFRLFNRLYVY